MSKKMDRELERASSWDGTKAGQLTGADVELKQASAHAQENELRAHARNVVERGARMLCDNILAMTADVDEFQKKILDLPCAPEMLSYSRMVFRGNHVVEEISEAYAAHQAGDFAGVVDGFVDAVYICLGALLEMGVRPQDAWDPVHAANMQKLRGETKRGETYDAVKPDGWTPPDHLAMLAALELRSRVSPVFLEATRVVEERGAMYNHGAKVRREDHFPFGMTSIFQMMWVKIMRMRADLEAGRPVQRDHLIDTINYSRFGVDLLDGREMK